MNPHYSVTFYSYCENVQAGLVDCILKHFLVNQLPKDITVYLALFRMDLFGAVHGWGRQKATHSPPVLPKIWHTYPTMMKLGTVIPYVKKMQKNYQSRDTPLEFC